MGRLQGVTNASPLGLHRSPRHLNSSKYTKTPSLADALSRFMGQDYKMYYLEHLVLVILIHLIPVFVALSFAAKSRRFSGRNVKIMQLFFLNAGGGGKTCIIFTLRPGQTSLRLDGDPAHMKGMSECTLKSCSRQAKAIPAKACSY